MQRRSWLKLGAVAGATLVLGGGLAALTRRGWTDERFSPAGRELFAAIARSVLEGTLPDPVVHPREHRLALDGHLGRLEAAIAGFSPPTRAEIAQLMALLLHPVSRLALTGLGSEWAKVESAAVSAALQRMRDSRIALRQQAYHALRDLTNGAYFSAPDTWRAIGYPGPQPI